MLESLSSEELQFIKAIEKFKQENSKLFLSWTEVLKIFKELGYKKVSLKRTAASTETDSAKSATKAASKIAAESTDKSTEKVTETSVG